LRSRCGAISRSRLFVVGYSTRRSQTTCLVRRSAIGTKQTSMVYGRMFAFGGEADIGISGRHVRDIPEESTNQGQTNVESKVYLLTNRDPCRANFCISMARQTRNSLGLTITIARNQSKTISDLSSFSEYSHTAKEMAKREGISNILSGNSV
jgi:hypothetical protein